MTAALTGKFNEVADPKVQLEQAIIEAQDQHRRLKEQAANVIANQKQTEMRLNRAHGGAGEGQRLGPPGRAHGRRGHQDGRHRRRPREYTTAAESFANRLIAAREGGRGPQAAAPPVDPGRRPGQGARCSRTPSALQKKLAERQKLLSQLDQAKMQEQMNKAMASLQRDGRPGRPHARRGAGQDRGPLRQGHGHVRAQRRVGREPHARGRAGRHGHRGPGPPVARSAPQLGIDAPAAADARGRLGRRRARQEASRPPR